MTMTALQLDARPLALERVLAPTRPTRHPKKSRGPRAHPQRVARAAAATVASRGCRVAAVPTAGTWHLTNRGLGAIFAIAAILVLAAVLCVSATVAQILTAPVYAL